VGLTPLYGDKASISRFIFFPNRPFPFLPAYARGPLGARPKAGPLSPPPKAGTVNRLRVQLPVVQY